MSISPECVITFIGKGLKEAYDRIQASAENDELRQRIERRMEEFKKIADELKAAEFESFPRSCTERLQDFQNLINTCKRICADHKGKGKIGKLVSVHSHRLDLETLEKQMEKAQQSLHFAMTRAIYQQNRELKETVKRGQERAEATTIHPDAGVYKGAGTMKSRPYTVSKPEVSVVNDLMEVTWTDTQNSIERYEVRYDDEDEKIWPCRPEEHQHSQNKDIFTLALGHPKVCAGRQYTISVRAVNSCGPGEYSEPVITRFKTAKPSKPQKPQVTVESPTEVIVETPRLTEKEENGSPVRQCVVVYNDINSSESSRLSCDIKHRDRDTVKMRIRSLSPDTIYIFRIIMVNEVGESMPSDSCEAVTTPLIPGPPQELRVSSKRTNNLIKIRWKKPAVNTHAVSEYQVWMQHVDSKGSEWEKLANVTHTKLSAKATDLQSGEPYQFRVCAINIKKQPGEFSNVVETETRCGKAARIAATTGAFLGGTVGGPVMGAVGIGYLAGSSAKDGPDSKAGKNAAAAAAGIGGGIAGVLAGTIGAPFFGGMAAAMAYRHLARGLDEWSPQTSDDEDDSMIGMAWKMSQKKTEKMNKK